MLINIKKSGGLQNALNVVEEHFRSNGKPVRSIHRNSQTCQTDIFFYYEKDNNEYTVRPAKGAKIILVAPTFTDAYYAVRERMVKKIEESQTYAAYVHEQKKYNKRILPENLFNINRKEMCEKEFNKFTNTGSFEI